MDARIEKWLGWIALSFAAVFAAWFIISELGGLRAFADWLIAGLAQLPVSLQTVAAYYATIPFTQLVPSLAIGAAIGAAVGFAVPAISAPLQNRDTALRWAALGALLGILGAQLFGYLTRHCTYVSDQPGEQIAGIVLTGLLALALPLGVVSIARRRVAGPDMGRAGFFKGRAAPLLLLAPTLVFLFIFLYYPAVQTLTLSLSQRRFPLPQERFVCLQNYATLLGDDIYRSSFFTTIVITLLVVGFSLALSLATAVLASQQIKGAAVYRTLLIWPFALSPVVTGAVFLAMFREGGSGLINWLLSPFGLIPSWLRDPSLARWVIVAASVWNILGFNILFYIAGLQNIPKDLLEAASIDGATRVQRFFRITFPLLAPFTFFLLVTNVTYAFYGIYGAVDTLTQGGPPLGPAGSLGGATNVLIYKLYEDAFNPGSPAGLAAAQAVFLFVMVAAFTLIQFRYVERRITYAG
jgi:sn-glycerol 3-phosphate transport system permease protein